MEKEKNIIEAAVTESREVKGVSRTRYITAVGMLSAVSFVLQLLEFPLPMLIPGFIKMDFSDLPALIAAFSLGPVAGVAVGLVKNLLHGFFSMSLGVGELANFLLCAAFAWTAGMIYKYNRTRKGALIASFAGAVVMAVISLPLNYFVTYPFYEAAFSLTEEMIIGAYQAIIPSMKSLVQCLIVFNMTFTFVKALISVALAWLMYKPLSRIIKGTGV